MVKENNNLVEKFYDKNCCMIAISSYLQNIFNNRGMKCIRVPFLFESAKKIDAEKKEELTSNNKKIKFIYAGHPSKKDLINEIVNGIALLSDDYLNKIEFNLIGMSRNQLLDNGISIETLDKIKKVLIVHGKINHSEVEKVYKTSDYSLLVRDEEKVFSQAGFPTKIAESLFYCTVPITNLTSDLNLYLKDEQNSIIINGRNSSDVKLAIERAVNKYDKIFVLRENASDTLEKELSVESYKFKLKSIIK